MVPPRLNPLPLFKDGFSRVSTPANLLKKHNDGARKAALLLLLLHHQCVRGQQNLSTTCPAAGSCSLLLLLAPFPGPTLFSPTLQLVPWCLSLSPCGRCPLSLLSLLLFAHPTAGSASISLESSKAPYLGSLPHFPSPPLSIRLTGLLEKSLSS